MGALFSFKTSTNHHFLCSCIKMCLFSLDAFKLFSLELVFCMLRRTVLGVVYFMCLNFVELWGTVGLCLSLHFEKFWPLFLKIFFLFHLCVLSLRAPVPGVFHYLKLSPNSRMLCSFLSVIFLSVFHLQSFYSSAFKFTTFSFTVFP